MRSATKPRVSVVMATFNRPGLLARMLDSIARQSFRDFEVIVTNDGGIDVSDVTAVERGYPVHLIDLGVNRGKSAARNVAIEAAAGELFTYVDDDDMVYPNRLEVCVDALDKLGSGHAVYTSVDRVLEDGECNVLEDIGTAGNPFDPETMLYANVITANSTMIPMDAVRTVGGFDENLSTCEDWEFFLRISKTHRWVHLPVATGVHCLRIGHDNATESERFRMLDSVQYIYGKHPLPVGSPLEIERQRFLEDFRKPNTSELTMKMSVVIVCGRDPAALELTLSSFLAHLPGLEEFQVLILVPDSREWSGLAFRPIGAIQLYSIGDVSPEAAWQFGRARGTGRHVLALLAGEEVDPELFTAAFLTPVGSVVRVGRLPTPA